MDVLKLIFLAVLSANVGAQAATFNIRDFGARGDKNSNDAPAIQKAIDGCNAGGGGTVYCPAGDYLCGVIQFKSNVRLYLDNGATIWASTEPNDFIAVKTDGVLEGDFNAHLIVAHNRQNISIAGQGTIRGSGTEDLGRRAGPDKPKMPKFRIAALLFEDCKFVAIRDIKILYSETWTLHFKHCEQVFVEGVTILNNFFRTNTDGIDLSGCKDVHISNCGITAGDDCICLKTSDTRPCENVVVTNCTLESVATAIKFGTASVGDFRDIRISNCTISNSTVGIGIFVKDGGTVERAAFENISIGTLNEPQQVQSWLRNMIYPVFVDIERRTNSTPAGAVRDITFRDIDIHSDNGILVQGMPESRIENATFENITVRVNKPFDYSARTKHTGGKSNPRDRRKTIYARKPSYFTLAYVDGLFLDNIRLPVGEDVFRRYPRSALSINETRNATIRTVSRSPAGDENSEPVIALHNCRDMFITGCFAPEATGTFLGFSGDKTGGIRLVANQLGNAAKAVVETKEVPADAVRRQGR